MGLRMDRRIKRAPGDDRLRARIGGPGFGRSVRGTDPFLVGRPKFANTWVAYLEAPP